MVLPFGGTSLMFTIQLVRMRMKVIPRASSGSSTKPALHLETWSCVRGGHLQIFWTLCTHIHCIQVPTWSQCLLTLIYFCGSEKGFEHFYLPPLESFVFPELPGFISPIVCTGFPPRISSDFPPRRYCIYISNKTNAFKFNYWRSDTNR